MKTKNHIKTPDTDTLRGIGKLGWTESGKLHTTLKRLQSSFVDDDFGVTKKSNKIKIKCSCCSFIYHSNNSNKKTPEHFERIGWWNKKGTKICKGSWTKQKSDNINIENLKECSSVSVPNLTKGINVAIDFTRTILKEDNDLDGIIETTVDKIEKINYLCNDGSVFSYKVLVYFSNIPNPINVIKLRNHIICI